MSLGVDKEPVKGALKYGDYIWDGTHMNRPVVIVKEDIELFEYSVRSPHVLTLETSTKDGCNVYEPWACFLDEFISLKNKELNISDINCSDEYKEVLMKTHLIDAHNRHTSEAVMILRDCIDLSAQLTTQKVDHRDLTTKNIVLCIIDKKIKAKVIKIKRKTDGVECFNDYGFLEGLLKALFSGPGQPGVNRLSAEARDLWFILKKIMLPEFAVDSARWKSYLSRVERAFFANPRILLNHPLFWTDQMYLDFILQVRQALGKCYPSRYQDTIIQNFLAKISDIGTKDWYKQLKNDEEVMKELSKPRPNQRSYDKRKTDDLLRFMRDMFSHIEEKDKELQAELGELPHGFFDFFRSRYPELLLVTRRVFACYYEEVRGVAHIHQNFAGFL